MRTNRLDEPAGERYVSRGGHKLAGALERVLVGDWLRKWSGERTFNKIWLPLLKAKLGECYRRTSAAFIWATIARMYAARRSGLKKERSGVGRHD